MFGINKLKKQVAALETELWQHKHPPKYKKDQKTEFGKCYRVDFIEREECVYGYVFQVRRWEYKFEKNGTTLTMQ